MIITEKEKQVLLKAMDVLVDEEQDMIDHTELINKIKDIEPRLMELEDKASSECWSYCYENGLTEKEQEEYDDLL